MAATTPAPAPSAINAVAGTASSVPELLEKYSWLRYSADLGELSPSTRQVLEQYSQIPPEEVMPHVYAVRDKAFLIHPYPCIGEGRFLQLALGQHALYPEILQRMRNTENPVDSAPIFLDLGCAFAQDLRRLVADGVESSRCYGTDLRLDFLELGYELFRDRNTLKSTFIAADIFQTDPPNPLMAQLEGKVDIINASSFFHLFSLEQQKTVARAVVRLLRPRKDSLLVGRQKAAAVAGATKPRPGAPRLADRYWHSEESWKDFWRAIGEEVGVEFEVRVRMLGDKFGTLERPLEEAEGLAMSFSVRRL